MSCTQLFSDRYSDYKYDSLVTNFLSRTWDTERFSYIVTCILSPIIYPLGMIGYVLALPARIFRLTKELITTLGYLLTAPFCGREPLQIRSVILLFSLAEVGSGLLGLVCPPLAYEVDAYLQSFRINCENDFFNAWSMYDKKELSKNQKVKQE